MTHWHLPEIDWLPELPDDAKSKLNRHSQVLRIRPGQNAFVPDVHPQDVFILKDGLIRMYRLSAKGDEFTLGFVHPGEVFGELAAFGKEPRESFAEAVVSSTVLKIPLELFRELLRSTPDFGYSISKQIAGRFKQIESRAQNLVFLPVVSRLSHILLMLLTHFGDAECDCRDIRLNITQSEFAKLVGASRQAVNDAFHQLRKAGLVILEHRQVVVLDRDGLRRLIDQR